MADLLREQFPYFRPIVEAFGYRNLEFEGWEADDVIATLATRADAGRRASTCVVSTDRDAFQLVTENVSLMMTPRGVSDVQVYTPERVEARYGIKPEQIPDFIGLKGDTLRQHPGRPRHRRQDGRTADRAVRLARGRARARRTSCRRRGARTSPSSPTRRARRRSSRRCGATSSIDCDPAQLVLSPPDRSQLREMFRRFEFRGLLGRVDDARRGGSGRRADRRRAPRSRGERPRRCRSSSGPCRLAVDDDRVAVAREGDGDRRAASEPTFRPRSATPQIVAHDYKALPRLTQLPAEDTMIGAYLIEPGRPAYELDDLAAEYGVEALPEPEAEEETAALVRAAEVPRRLAPLAARAPARARQRGAVRPTSSCRSPPCSRRWRTPASRSTRTGWARSRRGSPTASRSSSRARTSSPARSSCSARRSSSRGSCSRSSS